MNLADGIVSFSRQLRARGLPVTTTHAADALRSLTCVDLGSRDGVYHALRCVLVSRPEDFPVFDELFWRFFDRQESKPRRREEPPPEEQSVPSLSKWGKGSEARESEEVRTASDRPALAVKDFSAFGSAELAEIERIARRLARRLAARPSRRWKSARRGKRLDLRATLRRSVPEPVDLRFRRRKPRKTRIVALCDVSGSMDLYSRFLLQFLYGLAGSVARVESFVFSTTLRRITESLHEPTYASALGYLREQVHDWSGGTRIGACLSTFNEEWRKLVDSRTVVVILSDGWDTGDPEDLAGELRRLKMRSRKLVWLNPLLGSPDYQPLTQGMQAALPHLDVFASVHNLASLRALERHLL
jgi:uncharacterized protein with von Willebrand factor type A (vWA) domain